MNDTRRKKIRIKALIMALCIIFTGVGYKVITVISEVVAADAAFEASIAAFPESYKESLRTLHEVHPNWTFVPVETPLDWNTMLSMESALNVNLVPNWYSTMALKGVDTGWYKTPTSWLSTEIPGAYNWEANEWVRLDTGNWSQASVEAIQYIMDPRNWLTENNIFMFELLYYQSEVQTYDVLKGMMENTFMDCDTATVGGSGGKTYATVLLEAAVQYDVSPVLLCARIIQEKGTGNDSLGSGVVEAGVTYYNFFNINASGSTYDEVQKRGLEEAINRGWTSQYLSIIGGAQILADKYVKGGRDTLYFQKFWYDVEKSRLQQYMQNLLSPVNEGYGVMSAYSVAGVLDRNFEFEIPVYSNMPSTACARPTPLRDVKNPNYKLGSISMTGTNMEGNTSNYSLTPTFSTDTLTYSVSVPYNVTSINLGAVAYASTSTITGTGEHALAVGNNTFQIVCQSEYGTSRTYTVNVNRSEGSTYLSSLTPGNGTLDKTFDKLTFEYSVYVGNSVTTMDVAYAKDSANTSQYLVLRKDDTVLTEGVTDKLTLTDIAEGDNAYYIDVYPSQKDTSSHSTYKLTVHRYSATTYDYSAYQVSGTETDYANILRNINGMAIGTTVTDMINSLAVSNGTVNVTKSDGTTAKAGTDKLGTGDIIYIYDSYGEVIQRLQVIIYGDVDGNGTVDTRDFAYIKVWVLRNKGLSGIYLEAANAYTERSVSQDNKVDVYDFALIKLHVLRGTEISQSR